MQHAKMTMALAGTLVMTTGCSVPFCDVFPENQGCPGFVGESGESETANPSETGDGDGDPGDGDGDGDPGDGDGDPGDGDGDPACSELGCMCDGTPESCDPGLICDGGECVPQTCGNGMPDDGEACDDGNEIDGDGCDTDCTRTTVEVVAGGTHTCALIEGGRVRCWGTAIVGQLGYGTDEDVGDNETPASAGDIPLPGVVLSIDLGNFHTCALFEDNSVRCWGIGATGQLGNSATVNIGDDETLGELPAIMLAGTTLQLAGGGGHNCSLFDNGRLRCWGYNNQGQLGIGNTTHIGDNEHASAAALVALGPDNVAFAAAGSFHTCAVTVNDQLFCWGRNDYGQLGYSNNVNLGDNEPPNSNGPVDVRPPLLPNDATLTQLAPGYTHTCALFSNGKVICWGSSSRGQLGRANTQTWSDGPNEPPGDLTPIVLGSPATAISVGAEFSCALLDDGDIRCWGADEYGQLGLGIAGDIGDNEVPTAVDPIDLGGAAISVSSMGYHSCAVLENYSVVCWGQGVGGQLGYGNSFDIGDNETPASAGAVDLL